MPIPSPPLEWSSFPVGPFTIHTYAIIILCAIVAAVLWTNARLVRRGGEPWVVIDIALWAVLLGLIGARFYHVFTHPADYFYPTADPIRVIAIWEGGNAIMGALIGGAVGTWLVCRRAGIRFLSYADALAPALLLAQAIGRLGNYFNHELFGQPTTLPWGLQIEPSNPAWPAGLPEGTLFHPTFLYEMLWNLLGIAVLLLGERMFHLRWGRAIAVYFVWYGLGRLWIENLRVDYSEMILGMRSNALAALLLILLGVVLFTVQRIRHPEEEPGIYLPGRSRPGDEPTLEPETAGGSRTPEKTRSKLATKEQPVTPATGTERSDETPEEPEVLRDKDAAESEAVEHPEHADGHEAEQAAVSGGSVPERSDGPMEDAETSREAEVSRSEESASPSVTEETPEGEVDPRSAGTAGDPCISAEEEEKTERVGDRPEDAEVSREHEPADDESADGQEHEEASPESPGAEPAAESGVQAPVSAEPEADFEPESDSEPDADAAVEVGASAQASASAELSQSHADSEAESELAPETEAESVSAAGAEVEVGARTQDPVSAESSQPGSVAAAKAERVAASENAVKPDSPPVQKRQKGLFGSIAQRFGRRDRSET